MKQLILLVSLCLSFSLVGQNLDINPESIEVTGSIDDSRIDAKFDVFNNSAGEAPFLWTVDRADIPEEWQFTICDANLCYGEGTETCPPANPNFIGSGESVVGFFKVTLGHKGVQGVGHINFRLYDAEDSSLEYGVLRIDYEIQGGSSISDALVNTTVSIYPNPAANYFKVTNNSDVSTMNLFDFVGKKVQTYYHKTDASYDLTRFQKGIYYLSLYDNKGEVITTKRLIKD